MIGRATLVVVNVAESVQAACADSGDGGQGPAAATAT